MTDKICTNYISVWASIDAIQDVEIGMSQEDINNLETMWQEFVSIDKLNSSYSDVVSNVSSFDTIIEKLEQDCAKNLKDYKSKLVEAKICPLCGQALTAESINSVICD